MKRADKIKNFKTPVRQIKIKRMRVKWRKPLAIREVSNDNLHVDPTYTYVVYFSTRALFACRIQDTKDVQNFSNHGFAGKWSLSYAVPRYCGDERVMDRLYLEDESDLIMLRLCCNLNIDRILKINH